MRARFTTLDCIAAPSRTEADLAMELGQPLRHALAPMRAIARHLERSGVELRGSVTEWEGYGWSFAMREGEAEVHCMVQWGDEWLMMCWPQRSLSDRLRGRHFLVELDLACSRIGEAISASLTAPVPRWRDRA